MRTFLERWTDKTVLVDSIQEPVPIPQIADAQKLGLELAIPEHGLVPPVRPTPERPSVWADGRGNLIKTRELYPIVSSISPRCKEQVRYRRRNNRALLAFGGFLVGGTTAGAVMVAADPQLTSNADGEVTSIGPLGVAGFVTALGGTALAIGYPVALMSGTSGSPEGFMDCVDQATGYDGR